MRGRGAAIGGLVLVLVAGLFGVWALRRSPLPVAADVRVPELEDPAVARQVFATARALLGEGPPPAGTSLGSLPGRVVGLCAYARKPRTGPTCATADGPTLADAVRDAAIALREQVPPTDGVLKWDAVVHRRQMPWPGSTSPLGVGVEGWLVDGVLVAPSRALEAGWFGVFEQTPGWDHAGLVAAFAAEGVTVPAPVEVVRTVAWVEAPDGPVRLRRVHAADPPAVDSDTVRRRTIEAADHLLAATAGGTGLVRQHWDPVSTRVGTGFDLFWQAHAAATLSALWQRTRHTPYGEAAERAVRALLDVSQVDTRHGPHGGGEVRWVSDLDRVHSGVVAATLLAVAEHRRASHLPELVEPGRQLARFLVAMQRDDGQFASTAGREPGDPVEREGSLYYTSEAALALLRWHRVDPDPAWWDAAVRGLAFRAARDDAHSPVADFWLLMALAEAVADEPREAWVAHAELLGAVIRQDVEAGRREARWYPDLAGAPRGGRLIDAAVRLEGVAALAELHALTGGATDDDVALARELATHLLTFQYGPASLYWMRAPSRLPGGFMVGPTDPTVRLDVMTHAVGGLLALERVLVDETLPGGPGWTSAQAAAFPGMPADQLADGRALARAWRIPSTWELGRPNVDPARALPSTTP